MHVIRAGVTTGVDAKTPSQLRVVGLYDLHRQTYHRDVDRGDFPVAVRVYGHVGGVAVLVLAVARRAPNRPIVSRGTKSGMHIDIDGGDGFVTMPASNLLNHKLQLVEQLWIHRRVTRPHSLLIMVEKIADLEVLGNWQVDVGRADLEKSLWRRCLSTHALGEVGPNPIAAQHSPLLL